MVSMTHRCHHPSRGGGLTLTLAVLTLLVPAGLASLSSEEERTIVELLSTSVLVVQGQVEQVVPPGPERICKAQVRIEEVLKGEAQEKDLWVAEELPFPSDRPSYRQGKSVLLFLVELPEYSRWNRYRSEGIAYMAVGRKEGIKELDPKAAGEVSAFLDRHQELASFRTQDEKKKYLGFLLEGLASRVDLVQEASAEALVRLDNLKTLIGKDAKEFLKRFVTDKSKSRTARRRLIRSLSSWEGFEGSLAKVLEEEPEMRLSLLEELHSLGAGKRLRPRVLEACLKDPDPRVRQEALGFVSDVTDPTVSALVGEMALGDASQEVRARAVTVISRQAGEGGREILVRALEDSSPLVVYTAADEMRRLGGQEAAAELGGLLRAEDARVRFIGILMLGSMEEEGAREILEDASETHADPKTRAWSKKVLEGGRLDAQSIHQALGIDRTPK
jgi:hypothetical protein